jgi:transposase
MPFSSPAALKPNAWLGRFSIISNYDKRIGELFASHPDAKIFRSFPGAGPILAPRLLCAFGSDRSRWKHSLDIATFSGIAPVIMRSGKTCQVHWRWACPKFLRQTFHEFAGSSTLFSPWAKAFYRNMLHRGKSHHAAIRALAFKWIRILYRCWKAHVCYDEALYPPARIFGFPIPKNCM